ncbi:hypothetical protein BpHYR1_051677, partial [Brachionus plicatilis]
KKKEERASNVVASIPATVFDCEEGCEVEYIQKLANKLGVPGSKVKKARKITRAKEKTANNRVLLVVEMESPGAKADMIRSSRKLRDDESHKGIYINEDLTPSERITQRKLRQERDSRNDLLSESETFNGKQQISQKMEFNASFELSRNLALQSSYSDLDSSPNKSHSTSSISSMSFSSDTSTPIITSNSSIAKLSGTSSPHSSRIMNNQ